MEVGLGTLGVIGSGAIEYLTVGAGKIADVSADIVFGKKTDFVEGGKNIGGNVFEIASLVYGAKGVGKGVKLIADLFNYTTRRRNS